MYNASKVAPAMSSNAEVVASESGCGLPRGSCKVYLATLGASLHSFKRAFGALSPSLGQFDAPDSIVQRIQRHKGVVTWTAASTCSQAVQRRRGAQWRVARFA